MVRSDVQYFDVGKGIHKMTENKKGTERDLRRAEEIGTRGAVGWCGLRLGQCLTKKYVGE